MIVSDRAELHMFDSHIAKAAAILRHVMNMQYFRAHVEQSEEDEKTDLSTVG